MKQREKGSDFLELQKYMLDYNKRKGFSSSPDSLILKLLLLVSEIAEATEALRDGGQVKPDHNIKVMRSYIKDKGLMEDYLEYHKKKYKFKHAQADLREELSDLYVRLLDISAILGMDSYQEIMNKMEENEKRGFKHGRTLA